MIPIEVAVIAERLALEYKGSKADYEQFFGIAWKIYEDLQKV